MTEIRHGEPTDPRPPEEQLLDQIAEAEMALNNVLARAAVLGWIIEVETYSELSFKAEAPLALIHIKVHKALR